MNTQAHEMDKNDQGLAETIRVLWPIQSKKMCALMVPPNEGVAFFWHYLFVLS